MQFSSWGFTRANRGGASPPSLCWSPLSGETQDTVGFLGCRQSLLSHVKLFIHLDPSVLLSRSFSPCLYTYLRLPLPKCKTLRYALFNFNRFTMALWMASLPPVVSTTLLGLTLSVFDMSHYSLPFAIEFNYFC